MTVGVALEHARNCWVAILPEDGVNDLQDMNFSSALKWFQPQLLQNWRGMSSSGQMTSYSAAILWITSSLSRWVRAIGTNSVLQYSSLDLINAI